MENQKNPLHHQRAQEEKLREAIAACLYPISAYDLPEACTRLGLASGDGEEAFRSKRKYVIKRIEAFGLEPLLELAQKVLVRYDDAALDDLVSEIALSSDHRISEITRRDVLKCLNSLESLFKDVPLSDGLNIISHETLSFEQADFSLTFLIRPLVEEIKQHYLRNDDYSHEEVLIKCGALTCSQNRFFLLIEKLLDPVVRRGDEQSELANSLNTLLKADGYCAEISAYQSNHPLYSVKRIAIGAKGKAKNLIFASINSKPDLYFKDAINNDIAIRNETDAIIYEPALSTSGLPWVKLVEWWKDLKQIAEFGSAHAQFYRRLLAAVKAANSPGELAVFDTYYREFGTALGDKLPALIPQVYLHYDPLNKRQRGEDTVLLRQRMDFLMLLDHNVRIVIEVDGKQHYSEGSTASPSKYAAMVAEDRNLRLAGYELYRFGGAEFSDTKHEHEKLIVGESSKAAVKEFFLRLFDRHGLNGVR